MALYVWISMRISGLAKLCSTWDNSLATLSVTDSSKNTVTFSNTVPQMSSCFTKVTSCSSHPSDFYFEVIQQQVLGFPVLVLTANATRWACSLCLEQETHYVRFTDTVGWNNQRENSKIVLLLKYANRFILDITLKPTDCSNMTVLSRDRAVYRT